MHPLVAGLFGAPKAKAASPADLRYVLGLKWTAYTKAEIDELAALEPRFKESGIDGLVFDKVERGHKDISFWFYAGDPKRAFKALSELSPVSSRMKTLQVAAADRKTMKFSALWPK